MVEQAFQLRAMIAKNSQVKMRFVGDGHFRFEIIVGLPVAMHDR